LQIDSTWMDSNPLAWLILDAAVPSVTVGDPSAIYERSALSDPLRSRKGKSRAWEAKGGLI
jgi:hypothetical protein